MDDDEPTDIGDRRRPIGFQVSKLEERYGLTELPLDSTLCAAAVELPHHHRDPFDRFIIAAALQLRVAVVTIDPKFSLYGVDIVGRAGRHFAIDELALPGAHSRPSLH